MYIIKASGKRVKFNPNKVYRTCRKAGAGKTLADEIVAAVERRVRTSMTTREILKLILSLLKRDNPAIADRYNLKGAILQLGPGGFVFEKFMVRLLQIYDYRAWCPEIIRGACVDHEVDIIAQLSIRETGRTRGSIQSPFSIKLSPRLNAGKKITYMIECKYHEAAGLHCGLKEALYTWARFLDIQEAQRRSSNEKFDYPWLISNVKFSQSAIEYAECRKMRLLGWHYPVKESLEYLIEKKKVYPITILRTLNADLREKLFSHDIIVCQDLMAVEKDVLQRKTNIEDRKLDNLIKEARLVI